MKIWWKDESGNVECIETCSKREVNHLLGEYSLAFNVRQSRTMKLWAGLKRDEPKEAGVTFYQKEGR